MKNIHLTSIISVLAILIFSTLIYLKNIKIADTEDYQQFLQTEHFQTAKSSLDTQLEFWEEKLKNNPNNFVYQKKIASLYSTAFKLTSEIDKLHQSDALLKEVNRQIPNQVSVLHALSSNAITRHDFRSAEKYADQALDIGEKKFISSLLKTDALLERGKLPQAQDLMSDLIFDAQFDFLIRNVKINDQSGDLESAIEEMEKALTIAKNSANPKMINWSLSNLADMYGHDGRIQKSYETYLEALTYYPADLHSLKGIAWIAFSHDKNTAEAKRIIAFLQSIHPIPDYELMLSEIATFEQNLIAAEKHKVNFLKKASLPTYGNMYQSYIGYINEDSQTTLKIAQAEIQNRPHPMSYSLLAWATFQNGKTTEAIDILNKHVIGYTEEPDALFYSGIILKESGQKKEAKVLLEQALDASFELGPVATRELESHLATL